MRPFTSLLLLAAAGTTVLAGNVTVSHGGSVATCIVYANGGHSDDVPNILSAFRTCGVDGRVVFPEGQTYWIGTRLNPVLSNVVIEWRGVWVVSLLFRSLLEGMGRDVIDRGRLKLTSTLMIWLTGEITRTRSRSRIIMRALSLPETGSRLMGTAPAVSTGKGTYGTTKRRTSPSPAVRCRSFSGT